jgi:hypothetical protein
MQISLDVERFGWSTSREPSVILMDGKSRHEKLA